MSYTVSRLEKFSYFNGFERCCETVGTMMFSHVTPILRDVLHWFPVQHRIRYCIHGIGLAYLGDVCYPVTGAPERTNLRPATHGDLLIPRTRTKLGERSFRISAPTSISTQTFCCKPQSIPKRTENIYISPMFMYKLLRSSSLDAWCICSQIKFGTILY